MKYFLFSIILILFSCGKEKFATNRYKEQSKAAETQKLNFPGNEFSKYTTVKPKVDFLFLWDNSSSTKLISTETRYAMANTINLISENFDYRIIISPLLGDENPSPFWESYIVSEDSSSVPSSLLSRWRRPGYGAEAIFDLVPKGSLENGITRSYNLTKAGFDSGFFRAGAHMIMIMLSNGDDNSWMTGSDYYSGIGQSEYINNYAAKFKSLRDSKGSKTFRFLSVVAHSPCAGSKTGSTYKAMSAKLYSYQQQSPFPSAVPQGSTPDSFDFCSLQSFYRLFDGINAAITPDNIPYTYNYWPITTNESWKYDRNPNNVKVVVKDPLGNVLGDPLKYDSTNGYTFAPENPNLKNPNYQTLNIIECPIHPEIKCTPVDVNGFPPDPKGRVLVTGYFIKLNGSARINNPNFLDVDTQTPPEFYGYVRLKHKPWKDPKKSIEESIRVKIDGVSIPSSEFKYIDYLENLNIRINSDFTPDTVNPPLFQTGYFLKSLSKNAVFGAGSTVEVDYYPSGI
jgi:hypothetical protein